MNFCRETGPTWREFRVTFLPATYYFCGCTSLRKLNLLELSCVYVMDSPLIANICNHRLDLRLTIKAKYNKI